MNSNLFSDFVDVDWIAIIERFKEGVILISRNLKLVYLNRKAKEIYKKIEHDSCFSDELSPAISDLLNWLSKNSNAKGELFIMDYQLSREQSIRVRVHHLGLSPELDKAFGDRPWLLLFLEDRNAILQDELRIEQKKYNLTDRELQVLSLLSQSYSYQKISETLKITVNTVKFHTKNIYLKEQRYSEEKNFHKFEK